MDVVILGTSSAAPTLRRGLSSCALIREGETILFDCGEGTQFRMLRYGIPRRKFHHIFISHLHGDHIFGLPGLISSLNLNQREFPLHVHGPRGLKRYLTFMVSFPRPTRLGFALRIHEFPPGFSGVVCHTRAWTMLTRPLMHSVPCMGYRFQEADLPGLFDEPRARALGIPFGPERGRLVRGESITLEDGRVVRPYEVVGPPRPGRAVAYCCDTAPCKNALELARGADLLIHEATYGEDHKAMARDRQHSTIQDAAAIANKAGVASFLATHFSTRYDGPAMSILQEEGLALRPDLILARDGLRIKL